MLKFVSGHNTVGYADYIEGKWRFTEGVKFIEEQLRAGELVGSDGAPLLLTDSKERLETELPKLFDNAYFACGVVERKS